MLKQYSINCNGKIFVLCRYCGYSYIQFVNYYLKTWESNLFMSFLNYMIIQETNYKAGNMYL